MVNFTVLINSLIDTVFVHIFMCTPFHDFGNTCTLKFMCIYICDNMKISIADKYRLLHGILLKMTKHFGTNQLFPLLKNMINIS
jgi:hypothetical protein